MISKNSASNQWAISTLTALGMQILAPVESIRETPWSQVARIQTCEGYIYIKQMAPQFSVEPLVLELLRQELAASVPQVVAHDVTNRWFLMRDAGNRLRETLKHAYQMNITANVLQEYAKLQIRSIPKSKKLLSLGVKDWRLEKLPAVYQHLLSNSHLLQADGLTDSEMTALSDLRPYFENTCQELASFEIPATIEHGDFQDNNILINKNGDITFNDWGDTNITHPFLSLGSWLDSASRHHQMHANDPRRQSLIHAYLQPWEYFADSQTLQNAFTLCERIRPVLFAINFCRVASCPGMEKLGEFKGYIAGALKDFIQSGIQA